MRLRIAECGLRIRVRDYIFLEPGRIMSYSNPPARVDLAVRDGKPYLRRGPAQTCALVPGPDGTIAFLHMGSRAFKRPTRAS
jgi:hypothetical protein